MAAAIWSTPAGGIGEYPAAAFIRFCQNHGCWSWAAGRSGARWRAAAANTCATRRPDRRRHPPRHAGDAQSRACPAGSRCATAPAASRRSTMSCWRPTPTRRWRCLTTPTTQERARARRVPLLAAIAPSCTRTRASCRGAAGVWSSWNYMATATAPERAAVRHLLDEPAAGPADGGEPLRDARTRRAEPRDDSSCARSAMNIRLFDSAAIAAQPAGLVASGRAQHLVLRQPGSGPAFTRTACSRAWRSPRRWAACAVRGRLPRNRAACSSARRRTSRARS